jgi:hypothetical protein
MAKVTICSWDVPVVDERFGTEYSWTIRVGRDYYGTNGDQLNREQVFRWIEVPAMAGDATPAWIGEVVGKKDGNVTVILTERCTILEIDWELMWHEKQEEKKYG